MKVANKVATKELAMERRRAGGRRSDAVVEWVKERTPFRRPNVERPTSNVERGSDCGMQFRTRGLRCWMFDVERWTFVWSGRVGWFEGVERAGVAAAGLRHSRGPGVGFSASIASSKLRPLTSDF